MAGPLQAELVVNGEIIPSAAIAAEAQNHPAPAGKPGLAWRAAARALAVRALLLQEARRLGLTPEPQALGPGKRETDEEALVRAVLEARVTPAPVTDAALRAAYEADPEAVRGPALYEAAHILFPAPPGDDAARASAEAAARAVLAELTRDPGAFDQLARAHSACPSREAGGRLGQIASGDTVPEFEAALDALEEGAIAPEPVATRYGMHVLRLDARAPGRVPPFEAAAPALRARLERLAWAHAARALVADLVAGATLSGVDFPAAA
jgi:peptidyl-prolyl cis-trans isomerase C